MIGMRIYDQREWKTILLPFKGKIIYDGFISSIQVRFGEGAKSLIRSTYEESLEYGIIASLE